MANKSLLTCQIVCFLQFALNHPFFICRYVDISDDLSAFAKYVLNCFVLLDNCPVYVLFTRKNNSKKEVICFFDSTSFLLFFMKGSFFIMFQKALLNIININKASNLSFPIYAPIFNPYYILSQEDKFSIHVVDAALCVALRSFDVALKSFVPLLFFTPLPNVESGSGSGSLTRKASFCQEVF